MLALELSPVRQPMSRAQCLTLLRDIGWGVLAVAEPRESGAVPVAVPTAYAFDDECIYVAMSSGRKHDALARNPHLCLTITDVGSFDCWRSVAVIGVPRWIDDQALRAHAIAAFAAQRRPAAYRLTTRAATRLAKARMFVLEIDELHGFESGTVASGADDPIPELPVSVSSDRSPTEMLPPKVTEEAQRESRDRSALATQAMNAVRQIVRALRAAQDASQATLGVSAAQLFVLREIEKAVSPTIGELAKRTATAQSSVSEVVSRLLARKLVLRSRSSADRRRAAITLTALGRQALADAPETVQERMLAAFERLPEDLQQDLATSVEAWIRESGLGDVAATMFFEPLLGGER